MTDTLQTTTTTAPAYVPPAPEIETGELTEGERLYFKSGGTDTSGLKLPGTAPAAPAKTEAKAPAAEPTSDDPAVDGEINVDETGTPRDAKGRFVPKSAFLRVKADAKQASTEAQTFRDELLRTRERLAILTEVLPKQEADKAAQAAAAAPATEAEPDPEVDLFAWVKWAKTKIASNEQAIAKQEAAAAKAREAGSMQTYFANDVEAFRRDNPDFTDALAHGMAVREKMLGVMGVPEERRRELVVQEIGDIVKECARNKTSVASRLYEMAQTLGYTKKAAPVVDPAKAAADELARLSEAQRANKTLGQGGGTASAMEPLTPARVANMSDAEFSKTRSDYMAKYGREAWNQFLAGNR